jgi:hypothetical protein
MFTLYFSHFENLPHCLKVLQRWVFQLIKECQLEFYQIKMKELKKNIINEQGHQQEM